MIERREREGPLMKNNPHSLLISRIVTALIIGVLTGCIIVFFFPNEFFGSQSITSNRLLPVVVPKTQEKSAESESSDRVNMLKSEFVALSDKNAELKKQVKELTERLQLAEQGKDQAEKMILALGKQVRELTEGKDQAEKKLLALSKLEKAGPFGTVKALRTNPTVAPDEFLNPRLANLLEKIAVKREIIVTLANSNVKEILEVWFTNIKRVGISNYLVVALDDEIAKFCESSQVPFYQRDPDNGIDTVGKIANGATVSTLKFRILREFLQLGYSVLLSDIDIVYLQNPFDHLYRDSDVESMSDGHNNLTAYGYNDVFDDPGMGWSSGVYTRRIFVYNCGFFYIRPTIPSIELLDRVAARLSKENAWDQVVFNEELFHPSHPGYDGLHAAKRTMDIYLFMNSRVLFKTVRNDANLSKLKPVIIHLNYHRDKLRRMKAIVEYYVNGNQDALKPFPDGTPR